MSAQFVRSACDLFVADKDCVCVRRNCVFVLHFLLLRSANLEISGLINLLCLLPLNRCVLLLIECQPVGLNV